MRKRQQKGSRVHYLILANPRAADFTDRTIRRLTGAIRRRNCFYTVVKADSAEQALYEARRHCRLLRRSPSLPPQVARRGRVTSLVAAGGDGTVNLAASVALEADLPLGILPLGRNNNIAHSLCADGDIKKAVSAIINRKYRPIDVAAFGNYVVVGSLGLGLPVEVARSLDGRTAPKFAFRWTGLGLKAAERVQRHKFAVKVDAFRFEITPAMFSVNLLPYMLGLHISPPSLPDDREAEVIFDVDCSPRHLGHYLRDVRKGKYVYGTDVRLYRGSYISFGPVKGKTFLLDGDPITATEDTVELKIGERQLKVFC